MKQKEIIDIIEDRFKIINKLSHQILKEFDAEDIHDFRVEVKKLRAFLRLLHANKDDEPLIPKLLKTFYGYVGIIRSIQLQKHNIYAYITQYEKDKPEEYLILLEDEKGYWEKQAIELMEDNNFDEVEEKITCRVPLKINHADVNAFLQNKLVDLKEHLNFLRADNTIHLARKILKDLLYLWNYIKDNVNLPDAIADENELKELTVTLGIFRDKCIQLQLLQDEYLNKLTNKNEKTLLLEIENDWQNEKSSIAKKLRSRLDIIKKQTGGEQLVINKV